MRFLDFIKQIEDDTYLEEDSVILNNSNLLLEVFGKSLPTNLEKIPKDVEEFIEKNLDLHTWSKHAKEAITKRYSPYRVHHDSMLKRYSTEEVNAIRNGHGWYDYIMSNDILKDLPIKIFAYKKDFNKYYGCAIYNNLPICLAIKDIDSPSGINAILDGNKKTDISKDNPIEIYSGYAMSLEMLKSYDAAVPEAELLNWFRDHITEQTDDRFNGLTNLSDLTPPNVDRPVNNSAKKVDNIMKITLTKPIFEDKTVIDKLVLNALLYTFSNNVDYQTKITKLIKESTLAIFTKYLYNLGTVGVVLKDFTDIKDIIDFNKVKTCFIQNTIISDLHGKFIVKKSMDPIFKSDTYLNKIVDRYSTLFMDYIIKARINAYITDNKLDLQLLDNPVPKIEPIKKIAKTETPAEEKEITKAETPDELLNSPFGVIVINTIKSTIEKFTTYGQKHIVKFLEQILANTDIIVKIIKLLNIIYNYNGKLPPDNNANSLLVILMQNKDIPEYKLLYNNLINSASNISNKSKFLIGNFKTLLKNIQQIVIHKKFGF